MFWFKPPLAKQISRLNEQIDKLLIEDAGVAAEHDSIGAILKSAETMPFYLIDRVRDLSSRHAELKQEIKCLQVKRDSLVAQKELKDILK